MSKITKAEKLQKINEQLLKEKQNIEKSKLKLKELNAEKKKLELQIQNENYSELKDLLKDYGISSVKDFEIFLNSCGNLQNPDNGRN